MNKVINTTRLDPYTGKHHSGERLEVNDPRAWACTLAFYGRTPTQDEVNNHMQYCIENGYATQDGGIIVWGDSSVPVLYEFGLRWDPIKDLQPA